MATGERIKYFRKLNGMTQKELGRKIGLEPSSADIRIAQYESGTRTPKADLIEALAETLGVSSLALDVPDIDSRYGLIHTLFALEDIYGLTVESIDGKPVLRFRGASDEISDLILEWAEAKKKLNSEEITKEEYNAWRYNYPKGKILQTESGKPSPSARTVDDILAQLKANLDILKSQNEEN